MSQAQIPKSQTQKREIKIEWEVDRLYILKYIDLLMRLAKNDTITKKILVDIAKLSRNGLIIAVVKHSTRQELYSNLEKLYDYFEKLDYFRRREICDIVLANSDKLNRYIPYNVVSLFEYDSYSEYYKKKIRIYCGITAFGYNDYNESRKVKKIVIEASCSSRKL